MTSFAKKAIAASLVCVFSSSAFALDIPKHSRADHRIRYANYDPSNVIQLDAVIGVATTIQLEEGEEFEFHVFGDSDAYDFTYHKNYLFFKPIANDANSNFTVITNKRNYTFRITYHDDRASKALYKLVMRYPDTQAKLDQEEKNKKKIAKSFKTTGQPINWESYTKSGDIQLAPIHAWDDGSQTWFQFASSAEIPAIYRVTPDGKEVITNFHMADHRTVVLHKTAEKWHLRLGGLVAAIHNSNFGKTPIQTYTGTSSDKVERVVHGAEPQALPSLEINEPINFWTAHGKTYIQFSRPDFPSVWAVSENNEPYEVKFSKQSGNVLVAEGVADRWLIKQGDTQRILVTKEANDG